MLTYAMANILAPFLAASIIQDAYQAGRKLLSK